MCDAEPGSMSVPWDEVEGAAELAFNVWVGQPELGWAKQAWQVLTQTKLTNYSNEAGRYRVLFRLLILGGIYSDFCDAAWEEYSEPDYSSWAEALEFNPFLLGQLYGRRRGWTPCEDEDEGLEMLIENERSRVVDALKASFGGVSGLYETLWKSKHSAGLEEANEDEDTYEPDADQAAAYSWVEQGCGRYR
jgi:hypothetical protein